jgi:adenosylcobinamide-phosphate synthase
MGEGGRREATAEDIRRALRILLGACIIQAVLIAGLALLS